MIQFDRIENNRVYLGFTQVELDSILSLLEKHLPDEEITKRLDVLAMVFKKESDPPKKEVTIL
ncbi:hypothetical protein QL992_17965 [Microbacterium sp. APC 3898]|uniref:Uncharacterized protein n=1 Tax=Planococcus notacanthi TaxID=3035188 RepID=A0ABT7ZPW9_9BACL|nr:MULTISPECIES: hypothetical protein [Terrabacteria group]MDN3429206.1 hypothetical protein [Planococcus sp. APC 4016]MDN3501111.1 hypothetical protein [Microbacterium sp. APC 3898]